MASSIAVQSVSVASFATASAKASASSQSAVAASLRSFSGLKQQNVLSASSSNQWESKTVSNGARTQAMKVSLEERVKLSLHLCLMWSAACTKGPKRVGHLVLKWIPFHSACKDTTSEEEPAVQNERTTIAILFLKCPYNLHSCFFNITHLAMVTCQEEMCSGLTVDRFTCQYASIGAQNI